jgi:hypothetical protein
MGFVPLAFRAGSEKKARVHIFWQKRIRQGDTTTPYWFPAKTNGGSIREDRIVLPIPPGTHWNDAKPMILPGDTTPALPAPVKRAKKEAVDKPAPVKRNGLMFDIPKQGEPLPEAKKPPREKAPKRKADPKLVSAARELRDRWLEQVNAGAPLLPNAKYDVARALPGQPDRAMPLLPSEAA